MAILVYNDAATAAAAAATMLAAQIIERPASVLGLVTGQAPELVYAQLAQMTRAGLLDWSDVTCFCASEFIPPQVARPFCRTVMQERLFDQVNIRPENVRLPEAWAQDVREACVRYEDDITDAGGIDLQLLGLGKNGSLGFNLPGREFLSITHAAAVPPLAPDEEASRALTMGMATLMNARRLLVVVTGPDRADSVYRMINSPVSPAFPATALQLHRKVTYILDETAAAKL